MKNSTKFSQLGSVLPLALIALTSILIITIVLVSNSFTLKQSSRYSLDNLESTNLAEGGIDKAISSLNATGGSYNGQSALQLEGGEVDISVTDKNPTTKTVTATAYVPSQANPKSKKTASIDVSRGIGAAFNYAMQVGDGGLSMLLGSRVIGSVYSNGNIQMILNNEITGDAWVAGGTQPTANQETDCASNCTDFVFNKSVSGQNRQDVAQSFKPSTSGVLNKVALKIKKVGNPSQNPTVRILGDNNGSPNKNDRLASATLSTGLVGSEYGFIEVAFSNPPSLTGGTTYWIVIDTCGTQTNCNSSTNYWSWSQNLIEEYGNGNAKWSPRWDASGTPSWTAANYDFGFKIYMGGVSTYIDGFLNGDVGGDAHANNLKNLDIDGDAYYQISSNISAINYHPASPDPPTVTMPLSDSNIQEWKSLSESNGVYTGDVTGCPSSLPSGKYIGDFDPSNNCTIIVDSPIWFTGDVDLNYNIHVKLNPSYGQSSGAFIADGKISMYNRVSIEGSGTPGSYMILISEYDSQGDENDYAIDMTYRDNNGILYSNRGAIRIALSNDLTSVTGWRVVLGIDTDITYDEGLAGAFFSSGPQGAFSAVKGTYQLK